MNRTPLPSLVTVLRTLGTYGDRLSPADATPEQLAVVAQAVEDARRLLAAAKGPASTGACPQHPTGPLDPTDGLCLLCRGRRHRARLQATAIDPDLGDVVRTLAEQGETEAVRRHGARAVARAQAAAGRGTHKHPAITRRPYDEELSR
ncbi:hypothetical protein [Streptomyces chryseus]|uniref:Uncharacterized protein n=1 Tax=Streptomyces chryseus TaxID=68186 RepID=A0ABQ3DI33_9ACTN|nr:hypothetical protein [Streptomyces chryseus]GHA94125.1 hypothetical protein GCM10010346_16070 [Streptomyces chryseus]